MTAEDAPAEAAELEAELTEMLPFFTAAADASTGPVASHRNRDIFSETSVTSNPSSSLKNRYSDYYRNPWNPGRTASSTPKKPRTCQHATPNDNAAKAFGTPG
ncbi:hypothetical protein ACFVAV_14675 [Nocardia sp. NPDC057663]|uniref:hypothetical protein n=1 Tax=Nocardia sp. NPDC057663 TaxID=3346201 RepID=UPI00366FBE54